MKIKFLADFRGRLTREVFYGAGEIAGFSATIAAELVGLGVAQYAEPPALEARPIQIPEPEPQAPAQAPRLPARKAKK